MPQPPPAPVAALASPPPRLPCPQMCRPPSLLPMRRAPPAPPAPLRTMAGAASSGSSSSSSSNRTGLGGEGVERPHLAGGGGHWSGATAHVAHARTRARLLQPAHPTQLVGWHRQRMGLQLTERRVCEWAHAVRAREQFGAELSPAPPAPHRRRLTVHGCVWPDCCTPGSRFASRRLCCAGSKGWGWGAQGWRLSCGGGEGAALTTGASAQQPAGQLPVGAAAVAVCARGGRRSSETQRMRTTACRPLVTPRPVPKQACKCAASECEVLPGVGWCLITPVVVLCLCGGPKGTGGGLALTRARHGCGGPAGCPWA